MKHSRFTYTKDYPLASVLTKGFNHNGGILDTMLEMQARQRAAGGPKYGEMGYDDTFIYDSVSLKDLLPTHGCANIETCF